MSRIARFACFAVVACIAVSALPAHAQDPQTALPLQTLLSNGRLVRLHLYSGLTARGHVVGRSDSAVVISDCATCARDTFRLIDIAGVDTAVGRSHQLRHTLVGALAGGVALTGALAIAGTQADRGCHDGPCGLWIVGVPPAFGLGALLGGFVGAVLPAQRWHQASFTFQSPLRTPST